MTRQTKNKLIYLCVFIGIYIILNYIIFAFVPQGIQSLIPEGLEVNAFRELVPLFFTLIVYVVFAFFVVFYKLRLEIEIERPFKELKFLWLLPLLLPCFASLLSVPVLSSPLLHMENAGEFALDLVLDLFVSTAEDFIFVDVMISFLLDVLKDSKYKNLKAMVLSSIFFTMIRCYLFIDTAVDMAFFLLAVNFVVTFTCGYLAIYFDSALIPVGFHYLFNALNFIVAPGLFGYELDYRYFLFVIYFVLGLGVYTIALYRISRLMKYRESYIVETGLSLSDDQTDYEK